MEDAAHWEAKLVGRKYVESEEGTKDTQTVTKSELPNNHRVLKPDSMSTMDFVEDRLNVHLDEDNVITKVRFG